MSGRPYTVDVGRAKPLRTFGSWERAVGYAMAEILQRKPHTHIVVSHRDPKEPCLSLTRREGWTVIAELLQNGLVFNIKDPRYGAKGDGMTDDSVAVAVAYNAARVKGTARG